MRPHFSAAMYRAGWFGVGEHLARWIPRAFLSAVAATAGRAYAWTHPQKAAVVTENLRLLGDGVPAVPAETYAEFGRTLVDYFYAGSHSFAIATGLIEERVGLEHLEAARAGGRGALLLTPHLSFFELGGVIMTDLKLPMVALTQPEPSPELTAWRAAYRKRWGVDTVEVGPDTFQFIQIVKILEQGKFVAALFDRPHPSQSYSAKVSGGNLPCSSGILLLALLAGCPVVPVTVERKASGRYRLEAFAPIRVVRQGTTAETLQFYTQRLVDVLWPVIARNPSQWFQFVPLQVPAKEAA